MKLVAISILLAAVILAGAIFATRPSSQADVVPSSSGPQLESTCMMAGGAWLDGDTPDPLDGTCVMPVTTP